MKGKMSGKAGAITILAMVLTAAGYGTVHNTGIGKDRKRCNLDLTNYKLKRLDCHGNFDYGVGEEEEREKKEAERIEKGDDVGTVMNEAKEVGTDESIFPDPAAKRKRLLFNLEGLKGQYGWRKESHDLPNIKSVNSTNVKRFIKK